MSSAAQATCTECGATMLAVTATRTGGLCMACKQGIRKSIEASKLYYEKERQPDPFKDYWIALVHRVHDTPDGFYRLPAQEQTYYSVCLLDREVYNGGMHQFFFNSSGDHYAEALRGLEELGAMRSHALLLAVCREFFPGGEPPRDTAARRAILPKPSHALDDIEREFCADPDNLGNRLRTYALDHQLVPLAS
jgi:hypothetical protein